MQELKTRISDCPIKFEKKEDSLFLLISDKKVKIPQSHAKEINIQDGDVVDGLISFDAVFSVKRSKNKELKTIREESENGLTAGSFVIEANNSELSEDFMGSSEFYSQFQDGKDLFWEGLYDLIDAKISEGAFDSVLYKDGEAWSEDEEKIALDIYLSTKEDEYSDTLEAISAAVKSGRILRSPDAVEMKVNCYRALDSEANVEGLKNTSSKTKMIWQKHKEETSKN